MDEGFLVDNYQEADLYQDLTLFIKIFKKIMELAEKMVESIQREQSNVDLISEMKEIPDQANSLISKYHYQVKEDFAHKNTFYRFMCRLNQTIEIYKNRANTKYANTGHFAQFLEKVEQTVMSYTLDKNIGRIFKKIMQFTTKICQFCQTANNSPTQQVVQTLFRETSQEKNIESQLTKTKFHYNNSQSNFHKAMNVLNKRFNSLGCLDVDYNCFKMSFFHARNQKKQFFSQYFQRNIYIWREISNYSKEFQEYLKKRAKTILNRKNRFKERAQKTDTTKRQSNSKDLDEIRSASSNYFIKDKSKRVSKNQQLPILREASLQIEQSQRDGSKNGEKDLDKMLDLQYRDIEVERRKTNYQLKNVYLTLNKIIPTSNPTAQIRKNLNKINKDKLKMYGALKKGKLSLRTTKYAQSQKIVSKTVLEVKTIDTAYFGFTMNHSMVEALQRQKADILQNKSLQISKDGVLFKALAQKQSMRKGQLFLSHKVSFETQKAENNEVFGPETPHARIVRNEKSTLKG